MVLKATLVFIFGPNLKTKTLLRPRPKLNNSQIIQEFFLDNMKNTYFCPMEVEKNYSKIDFISTVNTPKSFLKIMFPVGGPHPIDIVHLFFHNIFEWLFITLGYFFS